MEKIPEIERIIAEAEDKTSSASEALSGAKLDATDSRDIAQEAEKTAREASEVILMFLVIKFSMLC